MTAEAVRPHRRQAFKQCLQQNGEESAPAPFVRAGACCGLTVATGFTWDGLRRNQESRNSMAVSYTHLDVYKRQCLECGDIQETVEALRGKGAPIDVEPKQGGDKNWQAWTHDPDGNKIELMKISPESPQAKA